MGTGKKPYSTFLDDETAEKIKTYAKEDFRSFSSMVKWILKQYIKEREKKTDRLLKRQAVSFSITLGSGP